MEDNDFTELRIEGAEVPPFSARGITQTLEPISEASKLERAVNGQMIDFSLPAMKKYRSRISCTDLNVGPIGGLWPGKVVTVDCVSELAFPTAQPELQERTAVSGSERTVGAWTFYRPSLTMICVGWNSSFDEYHGSTSWSYDLEEYGA